MALSYEPPDRKYILYVDEAGDPGLAKIRPVDPNGASEWLSIGAILIQAERESDPVAWVRDIREYLHLRGPTLHFRNLQNFQKKIVCSKLSELPVRGFVLLSNKKNMRGYRNKRAEYRSSTQEWFYNFCIRLLLERVTTYVERRSIRDYGEPKHMEVVFSNRGGMRYSQTASYYDLLRNQARSGTTYLVTREIKWRVLHPALIQSVPHEKSAGAQLADVVASSFYQAVCATKIGDPALDGAKALAPRMAKINNVAINQGVSLQPTPPTKANLTGEQKQIFQYYGLKF